MWLAQLSEQESESVSVVWGQILKLQVSFPILGGWDPVEWWSATFLAPRTGFKEDHFSTDQGLRGVEVVVGMVLG